MVTSFFQPGSSFVHHLDPRPKLIILIVFIIVFFLPMKLMLLSLYMLTICLITLAFLGFAELVRPIRSILPILLMVMLLTPPFHRSGVIIFAPFGFPLITSGGMFEALRLAARFSSITLLFYLYLRTTDNDNLVLSLRWFGISFNLALIMTIALRYIPYLTRLYSNALDAHRLRGSSVNVHRKSFYRRFLKSVPVLTSVLIQSAKGITVLAMALETRGLGRKNRRTSLLNLKSGSDLVFDFIYAGILITLLIFCFIIFH